MWLTVLAYYLGKNPLARNKQILQTSLLHVLALNLAYILQVLQEKCLQYLDISYKTVFTGYFGAFNTDFRLIGVMIM